MLNIYVEMTSKQQDLAEHIGELLLEVLPDLRSRAALVSGPAGDLQVRLSQLADLFLQSGRKVSGLTGACGQS